MSFAAPIRHNATLLLASAGLMMLLFYWEGAVGFGLADESFLWYGAQRVLDGSDALRFPNTHPLVDAYIRGHFRRLEGAMQDPQVAVYVGD